MTKNDKVAIILVIILILFIGGFYGYWGYKHRQATVKCKNSTQGCDFYSCLAKETEISGNDLTSYQICLLREK